MKYKTARFGLVDVKDEDILLFPEALYGFDQEKEFVLLPLDASIDSPMEWLQSLQTPELAFIVTDPFLFVPEYKMVFNDDEMHQLKIESTAAVLIRVIVTIPQIYSEMTANLVAPLVINEKNHLSKQIVLTSAEYDTKHLLMPQNN